MADTYQLKAIISAVDRVSPVLKQLNAMTASTRKHLSDLGRATRNLAGQVGLPVAAIAGLGAATAMEGIRRSISGFAALGDEVVKTSQRLGISTDEYQRIKYIAGQSGVSVEGLSTSMGKLNKNLGEAAAGKNANLAALLARAGISIRGANGEIRNATDLLPQLATLFERNKNAAVQARMGNALFGKSWAELAPLLQGGAAGVAELNERYKRLGLTMDRDALKAGEAFGDQLEDLKLVMGSLGMAIGAKLVGPLTPMLERLTMWAAANRDIIATKISTFVLDLATSLEKMDWEKFRVSVTETVKGFADFIEKIGGVTNALIGLALWMNRELIKAMVGLSAAVATLGYRLLLLATGDIAAATAGMTLFAGATDVAAASTLTLQARIATLLGTFKALSIAAAPFAVMWGVKEWAKDTSHDKERVEGLQGFGNGISGFLGNFGFNKDADIAARLAANRAGLGGGDAVPSALGAGSSASAGGKFTFEFRNAPPGFQVSTSEPNKGTKVEVDVGYRLAPGRF